MTPKHIEIVLPVLNEGNNLPLLLDRLRQVFDPLPYTWSALFVDDGSEKETIEILRALTQQQENVRALEFSRNFGHQLALTAGIDHAQGDAVILMDSDLQHPPEILPEMLALWEAGYEVVYTIRDYGATTPAMKKLSSALFYKIFNALSDTQIPEHAADFRLLDQRVVEALKSMRERTRFLRGLTTWAGFRQAGVHFSAENRVHGRSSYSFRRMIRLALDAVTSMSTIPLKLSLLAGFAVSAIALLYTAYVVAAYLLADRAVTGWSSLIVATMFLGGTQLITIGIVGVYVAKVFEEVKQRPIYLLRGKGGE